LSLQFAMLPCGRLVQELFPHLRALEVEGVKSTARAVVIFARPGAAGAACPWCGTWSARVHSRYARRLADGAAAGRPVVICLTVRRLVCGNPGCAAVTFAEQVEGLSSRYLRRSLPLLGLLAGIGLELAGRAGSRLAGLLGIAVHPVTLLRLVAALPGPELTAAPEVLGVDDFALRKGKVYGTVLVDMRTGQAVDLLPGREAATLEAWLKAHPGAAVICRDRAGNYAEGARNGAPAAIQVADRWHLWHNLAEYAEKTVVSHRGCLTGQAPAPQDASGMPGAAPASQPDDPDGLRDVCGRERRLVTRTRERHAAIHELLTAGQSPTAISGTLGLDPGTVRRFAREPDVARLLVKATSRDSKLDPFKPGSASGGTRASLTPPCCTPNCRPGAGPAACRPCAATSAPSAPGQQHRRRPRSCLRPARSPAGCSAARPASTLPGRPAWPPSGTAAPTWTHWPGT